MLEELISRVAKLDRMPRRGRVVPEIARQNFREIFHDPYRVVYRINEARVVILTVRHWRRAWDPAKAGGVE